MTTIDFYTHVDDRLAVAARIVAKAYAAHGSVRVLTPDATATDALDPDAVAVRFAEDFRLGQHQRRHSYPLIKAL